MAANKKKQYWLFKSEPSVFSIDDLAAAKDKTTYWDGVRNYQARNLLRDTIKNGDEVFFYHSNAEVTGIFGIAEVVREGYPDHTAFDKKDPHFDEKSDKKNPTWYMVDIRHVKTLAEPITLDMLKATKGLEKMMVVQRGSRLSVQPVTADEWKIVLDLAKVKSK